MYDQIISPRTISSSIEMPESGYNTVANPVLAPYLYQLITARKRSLGQGLYFHRHVSRILFTGGVCLSACWDTPPGADPPPDQTPPAQSMLGDMVNAQAVRILLECNLVVDLFKNAWSFGNFLANSGLGP